MGPVLRIRFRPEEVDAIEQSAFEAGIAIGKSGERDRIVDVLGAEVALLVADGDMGSALLVKLLWLIEYLDNCCDVCGKQVFDGRETQGSNLCLKCLDNFWDAEHNWRDNVWR